MSTPSVDITLSLAINPDTRAVTHRQSSNPSGEKSGDSNPDRLASMLFDVSSMRVKCQSKC